jgi:hypothetical protein
LVAKHTVRRHTAQDKSKEQLVSLHNVVRGGHAIRLQLRRGAAATALQPEAVEAEVGLAGSMRGLEAVIALSSIIAALLIGIGR